METVKQNRFSIGFKCDTAVPRVLGIRGGRASIKARPNLLFKTFCCLIKVRPLIFSAPETRSVCFDNLEEVGLGEM